MFPDFYSSTNYVFLLNRSRTFSETSVTAIRGKYETYEKESVEENGKSSAKHEPQKIMSQLWSNILYFL